MVSKPPAGVENRDAAAVIEIGHEGGGDVPFLPPRQLTQPGLADPEIAMVLAASGSGHPARTVVAGVRWCVELRNDRHARSMRVLAADQDRDAFAPGELTVDLDGLAQNAREVAADKGRTASVVRDDGRRVESTDQG